MYGILYHPYNPYDPFTFNNPYTFHYPYQYWPQFQLSSPIKTEMSFGFESQYPPVNPNRFSQSAIAFQSLLKQGTLIIDKLVSSREFCQSLMSAAQIGANAEVERLVKSTGVTANVKTYFTPDNIRFELRSQAGGIDCCLLVLSLRWG